MVADAWSDFKAALAFLTRLPVRAPWDDARLAASVAMFPLVGALIGLLGALAYGAAAGLGLPPWPAAVIALALMVALTGALHEDGLADTADSLGGATPADRLRIMRDSRLGSYGAIALVLALLARAGAIAALAEPLAVGTALIAAGAVSRAALPMVMLILPPARADGLAASAGRPHPGRAAASVAIAVLIALAVLDPAAATFALVTGAAGALGVALVAQRQIGGHTGDVLGAVQQLAEIGALFGALALRGT